MSTASFLGVHFAEDIVDWKASGKPDPLRKFSRRSTARSFIDGAASVRHEASNAFLVATCASEFAYVDMGDDEWGDGKGSVILQGNQKRMTPCQEYWNAASMVCPLISCVVFQLMHPDAPVNVWLVSVAQTVHMPVAMFYHIQMGRYQKLMHPIDNPYRVADQSFIMIGSALWALSLSGTIWYGAIASCLCILYIYWLLVDYYVVSNGGESDERKGGPPGRRYSIAMMVVLQVGPVFATGDWVDGGLALLSFALAAAVFVRYPFGGYSHAVFHAGLGPYTWFVLCAADKVGGLSMLHGSSGGDASMYKIQGVLAGILFICVACRHCC